jgi:hypothetical protein
MKSLDGQYKDYYAKQLVDGTAYQDFVTADLMKRGLCFVTFKTKDYEVKIGENTAGIEIKYDKRFRQTGNLYIEVAEKSHPNNPKWVYSGIYRADNSWLYLIGDYKGYWLFGVGALVEMHKCGEFRFVTTGTSQGFLLPVTEADERFDRKVDLTLPDGQQDIGGGKVLPTLAEPEIGSQLDLW